MSIALRRAPGVFLLLGLAWALSAHAQPTGDALLAELRALRVAGCETTGADSQLAQIGARMGAAPAYPVRREFLLCQLGLPRGSLSFDQRLASLQTLRELAQREGDEDTVNLVDIRRIIMTHADDDIDKYLNQLNTVRARIRTDASPAVMEALESSYGNMYFDAGNLDTALRHQLAALDWSDKLDVGAKRARLFRLSTIADLYNAMDLPKSALERIDQAFAESDAVPAENRISLLAIRTLALIKLGRLGEAEQVMAEAAEVFGPEPLPSVASQFDTIRAELLLAQNDPGQAMLLVEQVGKRAAQQEDSYYQVKTELLRGDALLRMGSIDEGLALMRKATESFEGKGQMVEVLDGLDRQINGLRSQHRNDLALELMDKRQQVWVRMFRNERGRAIAELEARNEAQQLEHRVAQLARENHVQALSLRAERMARLLASVFALLGVFLSIWMVRKFRHARKERDALSRVVRQDALTGASSRYQFQRRRAETFPDPLEADLGVILIDLDHFKSINDQYGHDAGDAVLKAAVARMREIIGQNDELYRWGGEEFLLILHDRDATSFERDLLRLLHGIETEPVPWHGHSIAMSISGGAIRYPLAPDWQVPLVDAIRWTDAALYLAKGNGRRRIEQITLTEPGRGVLKGKRPIDLPQLQDWLRHNYIQSRTFQRQTADFPPNDR